MGCQGRRGTRGVLCCALLLGVLAWCAPVAAANTISVSDPVVSESAGSVTFTITRYVDALISFGTDVQYQTADVSAAESADYAAASGTRSFGGALAGTTQTQTVIVAVAGDALDEANETFRLAVSGNEVGAGIFGTATIVDDDAAPVVSVLDSADVREGAGVPASFAVRLSAASGRTVSVSYATANGSATAGQDYSARSGTLTLNPGSVQATVPVPVLDDSADEPAESFELRLGSPLALTLGDLAATATIADNDEPPPATPPAAAQQPSTPAVALPNLAAVPGATGSSAKAALGLSDPRLKRPFTVLMTISCPVASGRCSGRITIFSIANPTSRIKALRRERRLGRLTFNVAGGRAKTLELKLGRTDRALLRRTGRMRVRAYALTQDGAGRTGVRRVTGTLIARTAHSSPSGR